MNNIPKEQTKLGLLIKDFETKNKISFKPSRAFYNDLSIGQKRFWQIINGDVYPDTKELNSICDYFNADARDFIK